jgi:Domain of unknown function (DUF5615)
MEVVAIDDPEAPSAGTSDPAILVWLEQHGYILVTENRSSMPRHLPDHLEAGRHVPGIFWSRPGVGRSHHRRIVPDLVCLKRYGVSGCHTVHPAVGFSSPPPVELEALTVELFLNKRERSSTAQPRCQQHHPQTQLCDCGSPAPQWWSVLGPPWHAQARYGFASRPSGPPCAPRAMAGGDAVDSCAAAWAGGPADHCWRQIACQESRKRPELG